MLHTPRLSLVPLGAEHFEPLAAMYADPEVIRFLEPAPLDRAEVPAQRPAPVSERPGAGEQKLPAGEEAPPPDQKVGEAPPIPTGQTATEAPAPVPDSGVIPKVNVQGTRRVESDAIRAAIPLKTGDTFDREKLKAALL